MVLQQYIQDILFRQEPCCLPKIGIFTVQHISARYDMGTRILEPPQEIFHFDDTWGDEEQCIKWFARKEQLVPVVAQRKMEKYIDELRAQLQTGNPFVIPGIGQLQSDIQGHITFTPESLPISREQLEISPVIRTDASHKVTIGTRSVVNNQVVDHLTASTENSSNNATADYDPFPETPSRFRWWWVALPAAALLSAAVVWGLVAHKGGGDNAVISADKDVPVDTMHLSEGSSSVLDSSLQQGTPANAAAVANPNGDTSYFIVVETLHSYVAAKKKLDKRNHAYGQQEVKLLQDSRDTSVYKLVVPFRTPLADTTISKDSIRNKFKEKVTLTF